MTDPRDWLAKRIRRLEELRAKFHAEMMSMDGKNLLAPLDMMEQHRYNAQLATIMFGFLHRLQHLGRITQAADGETTGVPAFGR